MNIRNMTIKMNTPYQRLTKISDLTRQLKQRLLLAGENFNEEDRFERVHRSHTDLVYFAQTYLGHHIRDTDKVGVSGFHEYIGKRWCLLAEDNKLNRSVIAAPRGEAKSTYLLAFILWSFLFKKKQFVVYIMDSLHQAENMMAAVRDELQLNPRIREDFETFSIMRSTRDKLILSPDFCLLVKGAKQRLRGLKFGAKRPDLILLDDIENDQNVILKEQRDKLQSWLERAVYNLGEAGAATMILAVGTVLHEDSVLARLLKHPLWHSKKFSSIETMPDRIDLWDEWEKILKQKSEKDAEIFYQNHRNEMEKGAVLNWPQKRSLLDLMVLRAVIGREAFNAEQQNMPASHTKSFHTLHYWEQKDREWTYIGSVDPSLGKAGGDPCAILIGGISKAQGTLDIIKADIQHISPDKIIESVIAYQQTYEVANWYFENIQFQEFLRHELVARACKVGVALSATPVTPSAPKNIRIDALRAPIADGRIRLHESQTTLIEQLTSWPKGAHDDGPDALAMLWKFGFSRVYGSLNLSTKDWNLPRHHDQSSYEQALFMKKTFDEEQDLRKDHLPW